jgi:hypothetical protein
MPLRITIIGGIEGDCDRSAILDQLRERTESDVDWEWLRAEAPDWRVPPKLLRRFAGQFRTRRPGVELPRVVKLHKLHGSDQSVVYSAVTDPTLAPVDIESADDLVQWLLSADAKLIPSTEWHGRLSEAALAAIFSKLVKNKSWNKDTQGHEWTKEADLLGQSPVLRPGFDTIRAEAEQILRMGDGTLFLSKGGKQGKTPKEWCIKLEYVSEVKRMILARSFDGLGEVHEFQALHRRLTRPDSSRFRIDGEIVNERVLFICRS